MFLVLQIVMPTLGKRKPLGGTCYHMSPLKYHYLLYVYLFGLLVKTGLLSYAR